MRFRVGARTDVGRVREGNEDSYMVDDPLFAVADGMGGHQGGEVASSLALETLQEVTQRDDATLADVVREANRVVFGKASEDPALSGMGTTLTAVLAAPGEMRLAHVGDSRAYLLRDGHMERITKDHTVVERLVDEGRLTPDEAEIHPQRSILTRALGVDHDIQVDEETIEVRTGDRVLLCSDGLTGMVDEGRIERILEENDDPQAACDALVEAANEAGGQDNITALVLDVLEADAGAAPADTDATVRTPAAVPGAGPEEIEERPRRRSWVRAALLWVVLPLLVIALALFATKELFVDRQWFVGASGENVALYRGIPAEPLGLDLSTIVESYPDLPASEVERFNDYRDLQDGITAESEAEARGIIRQMQHDLEAQRAAEARRAGDEKDTS